MLNALPVLVYLVAIIVITILHRRRIAHLEDSVRSWQEICEKRSKTIESLFQLNDTLIQEKKQAFERFMEEFFEGTQITNYILKSDEDGKLSMQAGNEDLLVAVDVEAFREDPVRALSAARELWDERIN